MLLAIDTSAGTSAAVVSDRVLSLASFDDPFGHAENVGLAISQALNEAGVESHQITAVVIGRGPAPYTGLRVGMAAGLAFAKALGVPAHGVMVLDAVAHGLKEQKLLLFADAKRRELFVAGYQDGQRILGPTVMVEAELQQYSDFKQLKAAADAGLVGLFARHAL